MRFLLLRLLVFALAFCQANSSQAFTQEVYVWQRQFSPLIYEALDAVRDDVAGSAILAAELNWNRDRPHLFRSSVNYAALAAIGRPVGLVLRIGPYAGPFTSDDETNRYLVDLSRSLLQAARAGGVEPTELQIDFDCASSKLAGYRGWLVALRAAVTPTRIVFTALPDWLDRGDFAVLAAAADGYVLQVHSLEKPKTPDGIFTLCDPERAWAWIERAATLGFPFRVALPTYGYRLAFDAAGKFIALSAEGPSARWPVGTQIRTVSSDATSIALLAKKLAQDCTPACTGIIWFRLPVRGDQLNWDPLTFKIVLDGGIPLSHLVAEVKWTAAGLAEMTVVNRGERDEILPAKIETRWMADDTPQAADGLGGYLLVADQERAGVLTFAADNPAAGDRIAPGRNRKIGWMRFSHEISLTAQIAPFP